MLEYMRGLHFVLDIPSMFLQHLILSHVRRSFTRQSQYLIFVRVPPSAFSSFLLLRNLSLLTLLLTLLLQLLHMLRVVPNPGGVLVRLHVGLAVRRQLLVPVAFALLLLPQLAQLRSFGLFR